VARSPLELAEAAWVPNQGASCTTASVLAALGILGARDLPELGAATLALGARSAYGSPALTDYVNLPGRVRALDRRIEALAASRGLPVRSATSLTLPGWTPRLGAGEAVVANLAWGQERPGVYGTWGWHPLRPASYSTGGHSVVLLESAGGAWTVLDPNHQGVQRWPRQGLALTVTRIRRS
jgi:hypothetical protein